MRKLVILSCLIAILSCNQSDGTIELGDAYFLRLEGGETNEILNRLPDIKGIPPSVLSYYANDTLILAKQRPCLPIDILHETINYPSGSDTNYYWIILKKDHIRIGPLNPNAYFRHPLINHSYRLKEINSILSGTK